MTSPPPAAASRHLDLGCGTKPRNPYRRTELHGVDIRAHHVPGQLLFIYSFAVSFRPRFVENSADVRPELRAIRCS